MSKNLLFHVTFYILSTGAQFRTIDYGVHKIEITAFGRFYNYYLEVYEYMTRVKIIGSLEQWYQMKALCLLYVFIDDPNLEYILFSIYFTCTYREKILLFYLKVQNIFWGQLRLFENINKNTITGAEFAISKKKFN